MPDDGEPFPKDEHISIFLNVRHCREHESAKKSFSELSQLLENIIKLDQEDYMISYFEKVEAAVLLEKEAQMQQFTVYYQKQLD